MWVGGRANAPCHRRIPAKFRCEPTARRPFTRASGRGDHDAHFKGSRFHSGSVIVRMRVVAIAAAMGGAALVAAQAQCFEKYQCIFHHNVGSQEYSWDMHQLCRGAGNEYSVQTASNQTVWFNICGNTSQICAPKYTLYDSHGVAVQYFDAAPSPCDNTCKDWDTGAQTCCTGNCAVLGTEFFQFSLIDPNNPATGGVQFQHVGMPPDPADPFDCPINPSNGLTRERQLTIKLYCDNGGSTTGMTVLGFSEPTVCGYVVEARTKAACGVKGDPFDGYNDSPGDSFGFVVLGSFLTIVVYAFIVFGNGRGWWDPIKNRMPAFCKCCHGGSGGSASGSSYGAGSFGSSYKTVGASAATPITASAYGTA